MHGCLDYTPGAWQNCAAINHPVCCPARFGPTPHSLSAASLSPLTIIIHYITQLPNTFLFLKHLSSSQQRDMHISLSCHHMSKSSVFRKSQTSEQRSIAGIAICHGHSQVAHHHNTEKKPGELNSHEK